MPQTTWATIDDVQSLTGLSVDAPLLAQANGILETLAGKVYTLALANTGTRDIEWMRRACAYQAAWMLAQPDIFGRLELEAVAASGRPVPLVPSALVLGPLAKRALARVSWLKSRSLHTRSSFEDGVGYLTGAIVDYDDDGVW